MTVAVADELIAWSRSDQPLVDAPDSVHHRIRLGLLDILGATVAGLRTAPAQEMANLVADWGGRPDARVLNGGARVPMHLAAMANATAARVWDLDDVLERAYCHVSASVVPAVLAVADAVEARGGAVSGRQLIDAVAVGTETVCRLALAPTLGFSETGASRTYECGTFGATLAAARIMQLTADQTRHALGIALSLLCGKQQGFLAGAHTVALGQGSSAQAGVLAAELAGRGITGSAPGLDPLTGRFGYYFTNHRGAFDIDVILAGLGRSWRLTEASLKPPFACCRFIHTSIVALRRALGSSAPRPVHIAKITADVFDRQAFDLVCTPAAQKARPSSVAAAQFSLPFVLATVAVHGEAMIDRFSHESLKDAEVLDLAGRVEARTPSAFATTTAPMPGHVSVLLRDGTVLEGAAPTCPGHPDEPLTDIDVREKFDACAASAAVTSDAAAGIARAVTELERASTVDQLISSLVVPEAERSLDHVG